MVTYAYRFTKCVKKAGLLPSHKEQFLFVSFQNVEEPKKRVRFVHFTNVQMKNICIILNYYK